MVVLMTEDARVTAVLRLFQPDTLDGGWGRMCPANVMNTSGGKRLVTLIKVTGGGGVGRAEAGDKTTPRHAACGRTGVVELRGASPGRQS